MAVTSPLECRSPSVSPLPSVRRLVVFVAGEADWATADLLQQQLVDALACGPQSLIVDLTELDFCNLRGLDALRAAIEVAQQAGMDVTVRGMSRQLRWLDSTFPRRPRIGGAEGTLPVGVPRRPSPADVVGVVSLVL